MQSDKVDLEIYGLKEKTKELHLVGENQVYFVIGTFIDIYQKQYCFMNTTQAVEIRLENTFDYPRG